MNISLKLKFSLNKKKETLALKEKEGNTTGSGNTYTLKGP